MSATKPESPILRALEPGLSATGCLDARDIAALARAGVRTLINNRPDDEDPEQLASAEARRVAEAHGLLYHHIPVTAETLCLADVDAFEIALRDSPSPTVVHCRSGRRSTLLWALVRMRAKSDSDGAIASTAARAGDVDPEDLARIASELF